MAMTLLDGNEAIARAAVQGGCRFFAGYPITPATTILQHMLRLLPPQGGICLQGEDEIGSIGFCLGASMTGIKTMTATSGPGISLCSEQISLAIGSEIPIVIVDVQRLGPSTGSATKGADGDIQFLRWGNSGGLPAIVLTPADVRDCYLLTMHGFNLAEEYRCPVFIASNKEIAMTKESIDLATLSLPQPCQRRVPPANTEHLPFETPQDSPVPWFLPMGDTQLSRQTSSTHGLDGHITTDPAVIGRERHRLMQKLSTGVDQFSHHELDDEDEAATLIITYGVTARSAKDAVSQIRKEGRHISLLILKTLYPVPENLLRRCLSGKKHIVVVEMNLGQYVREIERLPHPVPVTFCGQMNGELITPRQIIEAVQA